MIWLVQLNRFPHLLWLGHLILVGSLEPVDSFHMVVPYDPVGSFDMAWSHLIRWLSSFEASWVIRTCCDISYGCVPFDTGCGHLIWLGHLNSLRHMNRLGHLNGLGQLIAGWAHLLWFESIESGFAHLILLGIFEGVGSFEVVPSFQLVG